MTLDVRLLRAARVTVPHSGLLARHPIRSQGVHCSKILKARGLASVASKDAVKLCVANYSVEVTPQAASKISCFSEVAGLHPGTVVNVTFLVGSSCEDTIHTCQRLQDAGMTAVAHVPARAFESLCDVEAYFDRLRHAGVHELLVIGGGGDRPAGALSESMQILKSGLLQKYGFSRLGVAAHPEGHPDVSAAVMEDALLQKAEWAAANGVDLYYETQFCFEPEPIIEWEQRIRSLLVHRLGPTAKLPPVRVGVAGPAKMHNLIKFATLSGVGASIRFLTKYAKNVTKLATTSAPDELIVGLAAHQSVEPLCLTRHLHFYTFGGLTSTLRWANQVVAGNFKFGQTGFSVE